MASEYVLVPRPGYDLREVVQNPTYENSVIFEYRYGSLVDIHSVTPFTLNTFKPVPPPQYFREEGVEKVKLEKVLPEGYFASGISPFIQAILITVKKIGVTSFSDIYKALVDGFRIAPDTKETQRMLRKLLEWMTGPPSYLTYYREKVRGVYRKTYYREGVSVSLHPPLVQRKLGVDPIDDQICEFGEMKGMFSYADIRAYIMETLKWLSRDDYLVLRLNRLVKRNYLEKIGELYRYRRRIDRFI